MIIDMHTHLLCLTEEQCQTWEDRITSGMSEAEIREKSQVYSFISCGTPKEWLFVNELEKSYYKTKRKPWLKSFGIHPWYSDRYNPADYIEYFKDCDAVGEIGMDSVWCDISPEVQQEILKKQLGIAADLKKPVFLHTKGQEKQIYELVKDFPEKICVHWYSGDIETFEKYLELDCYFTLGPDFGRKYKASTGIQDEAGVIASMQEDKASVQLYQYMIQKIPADRLFLETDGVSAVAWAYGVEKLPLEETAVVLRENMRQAADAKGYTVSQMEARMERNLEEFLNEYITKSCYCK